MFLSFRSFRIIILANKAASNRIKTENLYLRDEFKQFYIIKMAITRMKPQRFCCFDRFE